ncbi:putative hydroxypyruvate reductase [Shimia sp. SK013]|uniref:glycerate kinase type-2 family protein n=1 Tax=Shimia sp. SK013 TaxID=1389006 RepID=UPI0006B60964|nr:glycerate kinase [Shimia sp. SK013]KPA20945.1 putative hydroxypyruvate reductase [Shimia sp. SK013]
MKQDPESFLRDLFARAVAVADPMAALPAVLSAKPEGRVVVVGAGKASARMAEALESAWGPCEGLVITRYGYERPCAGIRIASAAHPVPDAAGEEATLEMLDLVRGLGSDDTVICLISGGASSLLTAPVPGVTLDELKQVNADLLASGAPISAMNALRKHLCQAKGGQLAAAAYPAKVVSYLISDVPGDDPGMIGSGPTVAEPETLDAALTALAAFDVTLPPHVEAAARAHGGGVTPQDARLSTTQNILFASPRQSLAAAQEVAEAAGVPVEILGDALEGEARDVAQLQASLAIAKMQAAKGPLVILSGGELTVTRRGDGVGGPNAEFALALAVALEGAKGIYALACDTDGVDGAAEVAGAVVGPATLAIAQAKGVDAEQALANNDAHSFFEKIDAQVVTGPTLTNVNDFRALLVL